MFSHLEKTDAQISGLIKKEIDRQKRGLVMIPSENYASEAVLEALGTPLSNKYSEGYPGKRYYSGNEFVDQIEELAIQRAKELFKTEHANVQPHSGSGANQAVYTALVKPHDTVLSLDLKHGGHLTHGSPVNFSGKGYNIVHYGVDKGSEQINYEQIEQLAAEHHPKLIISGTTSYPRAIDFARISEIAKKVGAYHLADISHIVGLIIAGIHPACDNADVITSTTHKTLRGPRGAFIMCRKELAKDIDKAVFPGLQGGPLEHVIAAKAVCFKEATTAEFIEYQKQIVRNAHVLAGVLSEAGIRLVSGGTDNHMILLDATSIGITGKIGTDALEKAEIYVNRNVIPFEERSPFDPSGIRIGTPALTSRRMQEAEMSMIGGWIVEVLKNPEDTATIEKIRKEVANLTSKFPVYEEFK